MIKVEQKKMGRLKVLIVDDEVNIRKTLALCLESHGYQVTAVSNAGDAKSENNRQVFDLAFVDLRLGTENGMDLIPLLLSASPWLKIVVITAYASVETAIEAMRRGATDYISKPFTPQQVGIVADRVAIVRGMEQRIATLNEDIERLHPEILFSSHHPGMQRAIELAHQIAPSEAVIILRGPSGTGKTVLARAIHRWSHRADKPLALVSCPSLSPELLESELFGHIRGAFTGAVRDNLGRVTACEGGTLFLDEIGDLPTSVQAKLLRFIQDREYERVGDRHTRKADVRIITATNADLENAVKEGRFREDLYYRLNVIQIDLVPLGRRPEDVETLALHLLAFFNSQNHKMVKGFTREALSSLKGYSWPGNVRELRNVIERAVILCSNDYIETHHLPVSITPQCPPIKLGDPVSLSVIEENHIRLVIASTKSLQEAADLLGVDQATLWRKRKQYGI